MDQLFTPAGSYIEHFFGSANQVSHHGGITQGTGARFTLSRLKSHLVRSATASHISCSWLMEGVFMTNPNRYLSTAATRNDISGCVVCELGE